jgi:hypothetical protein
MRTPPQPARRFSLEHALILGVLMLFVGGAVWVAHGTCSPTATASNSWLGALPNLGLPMLYTLLSR